MIRLIGEHEANSASSGITLKCEAKCTVLAAVDWDFETEYTQIQVDMLGNYWLS